MSCRTELADKLSIIASNIGRDPDTTSRSTDEDRQPLINSINTFVAQINQYPIDYKLSCADVIIGLDLKCHPEGGFYRRISWIRQQTKTFYLVPAGSISCWHRLNGIRERWIWLYGGSLMVPQISSNCQWQGENELAEGKDVVIPEERNGLEKWGNWFGAYHKDDEFTLFICDCSPAFEFSKLELASQQDVIRFGTMNSSRLDTIERLIKRNPFDEKLLENVAI